MTKEPNVGGPGFNYVVGDDIYTDVWLSLDADEDAVQSVKNDLRRHSFVVVENAEHRLPRHSRGGFRHMRAKLIE